jgi:hypothetical protein
MQRIFTRLVNDKHVSEEGFVHDGVGLGTVRVPARRRVVPDRVKDGQRPLLLDAYGGIGEPDLDSMQRIFTRLVNDKHVSVSGRSREGFTDV